MHAISELFELSRPFVTHTPHTATLLRLTIILVPTVVLLALAVPAAKRKSGNPLRGWLLGLFAGLSMLIIRLPFITVRAFGAGIAAVFGQQPSITAELGFPWNADLLALGLFWVAAVYAYFVDPHPGRRRTVTVSLLFGAMALDVLYGRYLQAWLDAAEIAVCRKRAGAARRSAVGFVRPAQRGRPRTSALQRVPQPESGGKGCCRGSARFVKRQKRPNAYGRPPTLG